MNKDVVFFITLFGIFMGFILGFHIKEVLKPQSNPQDTFKAKIEYFSKKQDYFFTKNQKDSEKYYFDLREQYRDSLILWNLKQDSIKIFSTND